MLRLLGLLVLALVGNAAGAYRSGPALTVLAASGYNCTHDILQNYLIVMNDPGVRPPLLFPRPELTHFFFPKNGTIATKVRAFPVLRSLL
jgi:hypothetical protein